MLIKSITLTNFFRIYGEEKINCSTDPKNNVTVIKGDNGTGKTTMLSAFHWAFYGEVIEPLTVNEMLNKRKRNEMNIGDKAEASVKVEVLDKDIEYVFIRKQVFEKSSDGNINRVGEPVVEIWDLSSDYKIQNPEFFDSIIPRKLSGFFFFDGERIHRLAKIDGKTEIRQAILDLLGLTNINNIKDYLAPIKQEFNKEMGKASANAETANDSKKLETILNTIEENKGKIQQIKDAIEKHKKTKEDCENFLKTHNVENIRKQQEERERLEKRSSQITNELKTDEENILESVATNLKYYLIADVFPNIREFLEDKRKKKQLPSDIKETFINDLLASKTCICGRPLIENTPEYNNLLKLKETAGREELDNCYSRLVSFVNYSAYQKIKDTLFTEIYQYKLKVKTGEEEKDSIKKKLDKINKDLLSNDDDLISEKEDLLDKTNELIRELDFKKRSGEEANESLKKQANDIDAKIKKADDKSKSANIYKQAYNMTSDLEKLTTKVQEFFVDITQKDMDERLKEVFSILARKKDREPVLSKDFALQIVQKDTKTPTILSKGEGQISSLSFIGAIVSYSKDKYTMGLMSDFSGGDYPIVMDSPFGDLDGTHKENVAKGIPTLASQVIVILSEDKWQGEVENAMRDKVGAIYEMQDGYSNVPDSEFTEVRRI